MSRSRCTRSAANRCGSEEGDGMDKISRIDYKYLESKRHICGVCKQRPKKCSCFLKVMRLSMDIEQMEKNTTSFAHTLVEESMDKSNDDFYISCDYCQYFFLNGEAHITQEEADRIDKYCCPDCKERDPTLETTYYNSVRRRNRRTRVPRFKIKRRTSQTGDRDQTTGNAHEKEDVQTAAIDPSTSPSSSILDRLSPEESATDCTKTSPSKSLADPDEISHFISANQEQLTAILAPEVTSDSTDDMPNKRNVGLLVQSRKSSPRVSALRVSARNAAIVSAKKNVPNPEKSAASTTLQFGEVWTGFFEPTACIAKEFNCARQLRSSNSSISTSELNVEAVPPNREVYLHSRRVSAFACQSVIRTAEADSTEHLELNVECGPQVVPGVSLIDDPCVAAAELAKQRTETFLDENSGLSLVSLEEVSDVESGASLEESGDPVRPVVIFEDDMNKMCVSTSTTKSVYTSETVTNPAVADCQEFIMVSPSVVTESVCVDRYSFPVTFTREEIVECTELVACVSRTNVVASSADVGQEMSCQVEEVLVDNIDGVDPESGETTIDRLDTPSSSISDAGLFVAVEESVADLERKRQMLLESLSGCDDVTDVTDQTDQNVTEDPQQIRPGGKDETSTEIPSTSISTSRVESEQPLVVDPKNRDVPSVMGGEQQNTPKAVKENIFAVKKCKGAATTILQQCDVKKRRLAASPLKNPAESSDAPDPTAAPEIFQTLKFLKNISAKNILQQPTVVAPPTSTLKDVNKIESDSGVILKPLSPSELVRPKRKGAESMHRIPKSRKVDSPSVNAFIPVSILQQKSRSPKKRVSIGKVYFSSDPNTPHNVVDPKCEKLDVDKRGDCRPNPILFRQLLDDDEETTAKVDWCAEDVNGYARHSNLRPVDVFPLVTKTVARSPSLSPISSGDSNCDSIPPQHSEVTTTTMDGEAFLDQQPAGGVSDNSSVETADASASREKRSGEEAPELVQKKPKMEAPDAVPSSSQGQITEAPKPEDDDLDAPMRTMNIECSYYRGPDPGEAPADASGDPPTDDAEPFPLPSNLIRFSVCLPRKLEDDRSHLHIPFDDEFTGSGSFFESVLHEKYSDLISREELENLSNDPDMLLEADVIAGIIMSNMGK